MSLFKGRLRNNQCIIKVRCASPTDNSDSPPQYVLDSLDALIDTGAQTTCISSQVASNLKLQPESKILMKSATTTAFANRYLVGIFIPIEQLTPIGTTESDKVNFKSDSSLFGYPRKLVTEFNAHDKFHVLIGMDMLSECTLFMGHGDFFLSLNVNMLYVGKLT